MSRPASSSFPVRSTRRLAVTAGAATTALLVLAAPALAHVGVSSSDAAQGGYGKLTFRVPDERDVATTTFEVALPSDTPLASVSIKPVPGWSAATTTVAPSTPLSSDDGPVSSVVSTVTWTATAGGIAPGAFEEFELAVGPLPKAASVTFKALQTYADGDVVRWIETAPPGAAEPEHPAPVLQLQPAAAEGAAEGSATGGGTAAVPAPETTATAAPASDGNGRSTLALALAGVAALLALGALVRARPSTRTAGTPVAGPAPMAPADRADAAR